MPVRINHSSTPAVPPSCPMIEQVSFLHRKWMLQLLLEFYSDRKERGFAELQRALSPITAKVLTERLGELEEMQYVSRKKTLTASNYSLTENGEDLRELVSALCKWCSNKANTMICATCPAREKCFSVYGKAATHGN